jgi:hypothetical protein
MFARATFTILLLGSLAAAAEPESFDAAITKRASGLHKMLKEKGYTNIGVLKFLVKQGTDGKLTDDAGDLNLTLANKLETALVLANTDEKFGIIDRASEAVVKEKLTTANHRSDDGRKAFFTRQYELGWSRDKVTPAAFLTGVATLSPDLKSMTVQLQVFDSTGKLTDVPEPLAVVTEPEMLAQAGFSYTVPKATQKALISGKAPPAAKVREEAVETIKQQAAAPAPPPEKDVPFAPLAESPIQLTILYNDQPVKVTNGIVPEPKETDAVAFKLVNPTNSTYAAVLLVNGQNTLFNETLSPLACRKWVLEPGMEVTVRGFQTDADTAAAFRVTKPDEPVEDAVRYGPHAGTFRLVVYSGSMTDTPVKKELELAMANQLAMANTRGTPSTGPAKPQSLKALQRDLRGRAADDKNSRGYVVKGKETTKSETTSVFFAPHAETPVTDVSIKYIVPKN